MPVIVYKTMTIEPQGRRIECDSCQQPFVYIHGGGESAQTTGVPVVSNDDKMRDNALRQAIRSQNKLRRNSKLAECSVWSSARFPQSREALIPTRKTDAR